MIYLSGDVAHVWIALPPKIVRVWWLLRWPPDNAKLRRHCRFTALTRLDSLARLVPPPPPNLSQNSLDLSHLTQFISNKINLLGASGTGGTGGTGGFVYIYEKLHSGGGAKFLQSITYGTVRPVKFLRPRN